MIEKSFFELIQVALGVRTCLTHSPSEDDWCQLYELAKKQSLVGICFAAVQKFKLQQQCPPELLYLTWMGMAVKIQQRNEVVNAHCVEAYQKFGSDSCIMKGQGVAQCYNESLRSLRQSGDIDLLLLQDQKTVIRVLKQMEPDIKWDYVHAHLHLFDDTEIEVHYRPCCLYNLRRNKDLQGWYKNNLQTVKVDLTQGQIAVPSWTFNTVYLLTHAYHHLLNGGIGLRQMMDYYFVLKQVEPSAQEKTEFRNVTKRFGMFGFAKAVMYVMKEVFALEDKYLLCETDEDEGRFLLNEITEGGNFGQYDKRYHQRSKHKGRGKLLLNKIHNNMHLQTHYTNEVVWAPVYFVWHYFWKRTYKI